MSDLSDAVAAHRDGATVAVYAQPRASRTAVIGLHDGMVKVALKAPPVDGKANTELTRYLASIVGVRRGDVQIVKGESSRRKLVLIQGATVEVLLGGLSRDP